MKVIDQYFPVVLFVCVVVQIFFFWFKYFQTNNWFLFPFISDYGSEYCTKENKN